MATCKPSLPTKTSDVTCVGVGHHLSAEKEQQSCVHMWVADMAWMLPVWLK